MSFLNENVVLIAAVILIAASIPVVWLFDRAKSADHIARSLVAMGVGLLAAFVAVTIFELNAQKLEVDRNLVLQQAKRSKTLALISNLRFFAIEYGFAAYQIHATMSNCAPVSTDAGPSEACQDEARYAASVGRLIPQDYLLVTALSEASAAFGQINQGPDAPDRRRGDDEGTHAGGGRELSRLVSQRHRKVERRFGGTFPTGFDRARKRG